jgi:hypothetical protein
MNITINGKITNALPPRRGTSKAGNEWVSQDFVIEIENEEKICFNVFGEDKIKESGLRVGAIASVTCKVESKEWNGKWFTSVSCVNCIVQGATQQAPQQPKPLPQPAPFGSATSNSTSVDSLPF